MGSAYGMMLGLSMSDLHQMNPTGRFSDRAADYVQYRPSYPPAAIDRILADLPISPALIAADVGAGTGISARLLADRGITVIAIEPNQAMREAAEPHPHVEWREGTAEATNLPARAVDLVLAAQAFHWFRPDESLREFARILRPGGKLALVWNRRSTDDPCTVAYRQALLDVGAESAVERMDFDPAAIARAGLFSEPVRTAFPNHQRLDSAGIIGRAMSASYAPKTGPLATQLTAALRELHAKYADENGVATLVYVTELYTAIARKNG